MDRHSAIAILERPDAIRKELVRLQAQRDDTFQRAARVTSAIRFTPGRTGFSRRDDALVSLGDIDTRIAQTQDQLSAALGDLEKLLHGIEELTEKADMKAAVVLQRSAMLLRLFYAERLLWNAVWENMKKSGWNIPATDVSRRMWLKKAVQIADDALQSIEIREV